MLPLVGVPATVAAFLSKYRDLFCRQEGFEHVSRYITGLLLSENKTEGEYPLPTNLARRKRGKEKSDARSCIWAGWKSEE